MLVAAGLLGPCHVSGVGVNTSYEVLSVATLTVFHARHFSPKVVSQLSQHDFGW